MKKSEKVYRLISFELFIELSLILGALLVFPGKATASALSLGISPSLITLHANPPAVSKATITLRNNSETSLTLRAFIRPFSPSANNNEEIAYFPKQTDLFLTDSVYLTDGDTRIDSVTLSPNQEKEIILVTDIEKNEPLKDHYFSIIFISNNDQNVLKDIKSNLVMQSVGIATNVLLAIGNDKRAKGTLEEFSAPSFIKQGPVPFVVRVKNSGTQFVIPKGVILIKNMYNQLVGKIELPESVILAGATRSIRNLAWNEKFLFGYYTATLSFSLGNDSPHAFYSNELHFFAFPAEDFIVFTTLILLAGVVRNRMKKYAG